MLFKKHIYSTEDCRHIEVTNVRAIVLFISIGIFISCTAAYGLFQFGVFENYQLKQIQELDDKIKDVSKQLENYSVSDLELRKLVNLPAISIEERLYGFGGRRSVASLSKTKIEDISTTIGNLEKLVTNQKKSYQEILDRYKFQEKFLSAIPTIKPTESSYSSKFGYRLHPIYGVVKHHDGVDFPQPIGSNVYCTGAGVVEKIEIVGGYGKSVLIDHGFGYKTMYAHLSGYGKSFVGKKVKRGDIIGVSGNTGVSQGPHLHYEIIKDGKKVDPIQFIFDEESLRKFYSN